MIGDEKPREHDFQSLDETFEWSGDLKASPVTPVIAPTASTKSDETKEKLTQLLSNIYAAFEHRDDADVYDTLATSVEGPLLKSSICISNGR